MLAPRTASIAASRRGPVDRYGGKPKREFDLLKELGRADWLRMLKLSPEQVPPILILRGTRNLRTQDAIARGFFENVVDVGAPNGLIESVFIGDLMGRRVGFACVYGAAMASEVVHIFGALGARAVIQTGNCGALADDLFAGDLFSPSEAFCGEGAAQYYKTDGPLVSASEELLASKTFTKHPGAKIHGGRIYTTAALLAEGEDEINRWNEQGYSAVDMETATTFAVAESFGMARAAILYVFDNPRRREHLLLTDPEKDLRREKANVAARELAFSLAVEIVDRRCGTGPSGASPADST
jgi:purine-nucleoside phosphorylase